jgi:hypothetical protein
MFFAVDGQGRIAAFEDRPTSAAHSMDTDWYAVDQRGHVGYMSSSEEGAVPYAAHQAYWYQVVDQIITAWVARHSPLEPAMREAALRRALAKPRDPVEARLAAEILAGDEHGAEVYRDWLEQHAHECASWNPRDRIFQVGPGELRPLRLDDLPHEWKGILRFEDEPYRNMFESEHGYSELHVLDSAFSITPAMIGPVQRYAFDDFWAAGAIAAAYVLPDEFEPSAASYGIYHYGCSFSGPYHRREIPDHPLHVDELPPVLRDALASLTLDRLAFASTETFDPDHFADCRHHGG